MIKPAPRDGSSGGMPTRPAALGSRVVPAHLRNAGVVPPVFEPDPTYVRLSSVSSSCTRTCSDARTRLADKAHDIPSRQVDEEVLLAPNFTFGRSRKSELARFHPREVPIHYRFRTRNG